MAKAAWYAAARAFASVLASFRRDGDAVELWITNDRLAPVRDVATVALAQLEGEAERRDEVAFEMPANASLRVWRSEVVAARDRVLTVRSSDGIFADNRLLLVPVKELALAPDPGLHVTRETRDGALVFTLAANHYALAVQLRSDDPVLRFDTNHFDLATGEQCDVIVTHRDGAPVAADSIEMTCFNAKVVTSSEVLA